MTWGHNGLACTSSLLGTNDSPMLCRSYSEDSVADCRVGTCLPSPHSDPVFPTGAQGKMAQPQDPRRPLPRALGLPGGMPLGDLVSLGTLTWSIKQCWNHSLV